MSCRGIQVSAVCVAARAGQLADIGDKIPGSPAGQPGYMPFVVSVAPTRVRYIAGGEIGGETVNIIITTDAFGKYERAREIPSPPIPV